MSVHKQLPEIGEEIRKESAKALARNSLWATHVLICGTCGSFNVVAPAGARAEILDDGLPVAETCHECEKPTRQWDVRGLDKRQG